MASLRLATLAYALPHALSHTEFTEENLHYLMKGNYVLVNCYSYVFREPKKGDIVLIKRKTKDPSDHVNLSIKRITGIPGDEVEFQNSNNSSRTETVSLSEGEYFMVGDNAADSYDSRHYGSVKGSTIIGKVIFIK